MATADDDFAFDVRGFITLRETLLPEAITELRVAAAAPPEEMLLHPAVRELLVHPLLVRYLNHFIGPGFRLDKIPTVLCESTCDTAAPLRGGNEPLDPAKGYFFKNGEASSQMVRVVWCLEDVGADPGGLAIIPASHRVGVPTPDRIMSAPHLRVNPASGCRAGDVLLVAGSCCQGFEPFRDPTARSLLSFDFVARGAVHSAGPGPMPSGGQPRPDLWDELRPEQQAMLHQPGFADTAPAPVIVTDGKTSTLDPNATEPFHPSYLTVDESSGIDPLEFYEWELNGVMVLRGVMDAAWLAEANAAVDAAEATETVIGGDKARVRGAILAGLDKPGKVMSGHEMATVGGLIDKIPEREVFQRMLAHPAVQHRLNWM